MDIKAHRIYHIYNRGNNRVPIFYEKENYIFFLKKMRRHLCLKSKVMAYCLMPNHFHWMLYARGFETQKDTVHPLNQSIGTLLSSYTKAMNNRYDRTGSLFQQKTKSVLIDSETQALTCFHYIHQNPLKAGLVNVMRHWPYASYPDYCGDRNGSLIAKKFTFDMLNIRREDVAEISRQAIDPTKLEKLFE